MKDRFIAYNAVEGECEFFDTLIDAQKYIEDCIGHTEPEGYHPESEFCQIYELRQTVEIIEYHENSFIREFKDVDKLEVEKQNWYLKLLVKLQKIKSGELLLKDYIKEVEFKIK